MWTQENRHRYDRSKLRYPSDLTDVEGSHVVSLIPPAKRGGCKRTVDVREVVKRMMHVLSTGCPWQAIEAAAVRRHGSCARRGDGLLLGSQMFAVAMTVETAQNRLS